MPDERKIEISRDVKFLRDSHAIKYKFDDFAPQNYICDLKNLYLPPTMVSETLAEMKATPKKTHPEKTSNTPRSRMDRTWHPRKEENLEDLRAPRSRRQRMRRNVVEVEA